MSDLITDRNVRVTTPLPEGVLALEQMDGHEALGQPFAYELSLLSTDWAIDLTKLLGQPMTVHCLLPTGTTRYFNGIVTRASHLEGESEFARYSVTLHPWLWLLDYGSDCRIFQDATVPEILKEVFRRAGFSDFEDTLDQGAYPTLEYCVQYRESDFNFVSRLMEHEGIYYFFKHEENRHTLVLADSHGAHAPQPGYEQIEYKPPKEMSRTEREHLSSWVVAQQIRSGGFATTDFDFKLPRSPLLSALNRPKKNAQAEYELFDYPGDYLTKGQGESRAKVRLEERQAEYEVVQAAGDVRGPGAGHLFKLIDHHREDQNKEYLVVSALYSVHVGEFESGGGHAPDEFRISLTLIDSQVPYRPPLRAHKYRVEGPQTAIVVGESGQEIWTDKYGRVMVQFHWDRYGMSDERSSCWVRVAQVWAGPKWGAMHIPRIGQEVIVDFLEGDPDRPIITGRVYNGDNMPPYDLPDNKTQSGIKSRSTPGGSPSNFNEIRFEDKKGKEEVFIQAEKNKTVKVKNDRSASIGANDSISVGGDRSVSVTGNLAVTVSGGGKSPNHSSHSVTGKYNLHASDTIEEDAPTHIKLVCGDSYFLMEPGKITLFAGGKAMIVLDNHVLAASSDESVVVLDENAFVASKKGGKVLLDANVKAQSKAESTLVLDGDATVVTKGDVKLGGTNVEAGGSQKVTANGGGAQLELSAAGANLSGQKVGIAGTSMTEIMGALVKIN